MSENGDMTNRVPFEDLTLEAKVSRNTERLNRYQTQGVQIDSGSLRIGTMLEVLLGDRLEEAEEICQDRLNEALDRVDQQQAQAASAQLAAMGGAKGIG